MAEQSRHTSHSRPLNMSTRSLAESQAFGRSSLRPLGGFLNTLNPMGRNYKGYFRADQSVVEEDEEVEDDDDPLERGSSANRTAGNPLLPKLSSSRRVAWDNSTRMDALRPNVRERDQVHEDSSDDEVPQSIMIEGTSHRKPATTPKAKGKSKAHSTRSPRSRGPILPTTNEVPLHISMPPRPSDTETYPTAHPSSQSHKPMRGLDEYERALWNWVNVLNLDAFLQDVYAYYEGKGIYCIALSKGLNLLTQGFVIGFSTFLLGCIDYSRIRADGNSKLSEIVIPRCVAQFSGFTWLFFIFLGTVYIAQIVFFVFEIMNLMDMYRFYTYLLRIPDADIQTISWPEIVRRIGAIREDNPVTAISSTHQGNSSSVTAKLDAHDIANRIMRRENYLIAIFNKELLDLRMPLPRLLRRFVTPEEGKGSTLTQALEWNLRFCLMQYLFDANGNVRKVFLKKKHRAALIEGLERRFVFAGIANAILAPFIVIYLLMYFFFRYFEEYHKNPSSIGSRKYTSYAQWMFREFNELPHLFARRLDESYPVAGMYIGQFPNEKVALIMRFVSFIAGSFAAVLILASVVDPELFLHFEITDHRTVVFYITVFTSILAVARGMIPEENKVFDPELLMEEVVAYTHYMPTEWKGQLHSKTIHQEFGKLFGMKVMIFAQELLSVLLTPFILWYSLRPCAPVIVDFFRDFTIHVDGLGYVCSFAVFDFKRHGNVHFGAPTEAKEERFRSKEGKMEKSFLNFKAAHPDWTPADPSGSLYLSRMGQLSQAQTSRRRMRDSMAMGGSVFGFTGQDPRQPFGGSVYRRRDGQSSMMLNESVTTGARWFGQPGVGGTGVEDVAASTQSAVTAIMEDSAATAPPIQSEIRVEDRALDGGVESHLGDSYIDGKLQRGRSSQPTQNSQLEEEDEIETGGMLGLLTQIYGTRGAGPAHVI